MKIIAKIFPLVIAIYFVSCSISNAQNFTISSSDINPGELIKEKHVFSGMGCKGKNISPQISWQNAPAGTKSFAITVYDPDAPTGSGWWHWIVVNIPASYNKIPAGFGEKNLFRLPNGINQIRNDFGTFSFGGSCPPKGDKPHRYIFSIYALKTDKIVIEEKASAALAGFMIYQNIITASSFEAYYSR